MNSITIVMTTYIKNKKRAEVVEQALFTWKENLIYEGIIYLILSDDGSTFPFTSRTIDDG